MSIQQNETPLTEREERQLARLLSDPTKYPQTLKTWIISWLEGSDLSLPMSSVNGLASMLGLNGSTSVSVLPAGTVLVFAGAVPPADALLCNGASYERAKYPRLFGAIGVTYGSVDATHFNVPNLAGAPTGSYVIVA